MNKVVFIGRLTKDPELATTNSGVSVCNFSIAVNRQYDNEQTDFINIVAWRGLADVCFKYLKKGAKVAICGSLQTRNYENSEGDKRYVTEIVASDIEFLERLKNDA